MEIHNQGQHQGRASLLTVPKELRLEIYHHLFRSTTLYYRPSNSTARNTSETQLAISILLTCRALYEETRSLWLSKCTFRFADTIRFLDILTPLAGTEKIQNIRKAVVEKAYPICILRKNRESFRHSRFDDALRLMPGLKLDELVLGDVYHNPILDDEESWQEFGSESDADRDSYKIIENMIQSTNGWRELRYCCQTGTMFTWGSYDNGLNGDRYKRWLQPRNWRKKLHEREQNTSFEVKLFKVLSSSFAHIFEAAVAGTQPGDWKESQQRGPAAGTGEDDMQPEIEDWDSDFPNVVVVRRSLDADYMQDDADSKLSTDLGQMTWSELKRNGLCWDPRIDLSAAVG